MAKLRTTKSFGVVWPITVVVPSGSKHSGAGSTNRSEPHLVVAPTRRHRFQTLSARGMRPFTCHFRPLLWHRFQFFLEPVPPFFGTGSKIFLRPPGEGLEPAMRCPQTHWCRLFGSKCVEPGSKYYFLLAGLIGGKHPIITTHDPPKYTLT